LNSFQGYILANAAIVPAGTAGSVDVFASNATDLIIDINGYYAAAGNAPAPGGTALPQGSAAAPALSFTNSPGTGVFSSGPGALDLAAGGVNGLRLDSTGTVTVTAGVNTNGPVNMIFDPVVPTEFPGAPDRKLDPEERNAILAGGSPPCLSTRAWMTNGMFACQDSDHMYVGLKNQGNDRKDAVVAWGDNIATDPGASGVQRWGRRSAADRTDGRLRAWCRTGTSASATRLHSRG